MEESSHEQQRGIIVPLGGFVIEIVLVLTRWPAEKSVEELRQRVQPVRT